jgi:hypothetical protein
MKQILFLAIAFFAISVTSSCDKSDNDNETNAFVYDGDWSGTMTGGDRGQISFTVETDGTLSGNGFSSQSQSSFNLTGTVNSSGQLDVTSSNSNNSFIGTLTASTGSGTWTDKGAQLTGNWTATKD